jgi:hypothetical protein
MITRAALYATSDILFWFLLTIYLVVAAERQDPASLRRTKTSQSWG